MGLSGRGKVSFEMGVFVNSVDWAVVFTWSFDWTLHAHSNKMNKSNRVFFGLYFAQITHVFRVRSWLYVSPCITYRALDIRDRFLLGISHDVSLRHQQLNLRIDLLAGPHIMPYTPDTKHRPAADKEDHHIP